MLRRRELDRVRREQFDFFDWIFVAIIVVCVIFFGYLYLEAYATWW